MDAFLNELPQYWMDSAIRGLEGVRRSLSDPYPVDEDPPGATAYTVIHQSGKVSLRYYCARERRYRTPLLLVYALLKRPFILDLVPGRSVVENLTRSGFDVYLTDWIPPSRADSWRGFDAYVNQDLFNATRATIEHAGVSQVNLLGYCFGGLLSVIYSALHCETVKNLVALTTPIDPEGVLFKLATQLSDEAVDTITQLFGNCPAWLFKAAFTSMSSLRYLMDLYCDQNRETPKDIPRLCERFETWINSDVPMAGAIFREVMKDVFRRNLLARGEFTVGDRRVDLGNITCPLLNLMGEYDVVVPPRWSLPLLDMVGSSDKQNLIFPTGHLGPAISTAAHKGLWPEVVAWLAERDQ